MPVTFNVISLGKQTIMDSTEGNTTAESASKLVGKVFGSKTDPLFKHFVVFKPEADGYAQMAPTDVYNQNANATTTTKNEYFNAGGLRQAFDSVAIFNATITYVDGKTANITAVIFQDFNGLTYLAPEATQNADQNVLEAKPIQGLKLNSLSTNVQSGLTANRDAWQFVTCFCRGTMIETADGQRLVETLKAGDCVRTKDNGFQPVRWIGSRKLSAAELIASPNLRPVRIRAGALGVATPKQDLSVSPQHRILVRSKIAQKMFGASEVLVAAKQLLEIDGVDVVENMSETEYFHILFDRHEIVFSNGAETESLHTGEQALKSLSLAAQAEIFALFPGHERARDDSGTQSCTLAGIRAGGKTACPTTSQK